MMRNGLIIGVCILTGIYVLLSVLDYNGQYVAERTLWKLNREFGRLTKDPEGAPPISYNQLIDKYEKFSRKFFGLRVSVLGELFAGKVYVVKKDYQKAREKFEEIFLKTQDQPDIAIQALEEIGNTYALEEDWENLKLTYDRVFNLYPLTETGLQVPLLIAEFYAKRSDPQKAAEAYKEALRYYQGLVKKYPDTKIEFYVLHILANIYLAEQKWEEAISILGKMLLKFSSQMDSRTADQIVRTINTVCVSRYKNYDHVISIYQEFIKNHPPPHPLNKIFQMMIQSLEELKLKQEQSEVSK